MAMNWGTGLVRLSALVGIIVLAAIPIEAGPSLIETTRDHVDEIANRNAWETANVPTNQVMVQGDTIMSQIGRTELLAGGATIAMIAALGLAAWVVAGFRRAEG
jgi:hypothetical protein